MALLARLEKEITEKRLQMKTKKMFFYHDIAPCHKSIAMSSGPFLPFFDQRMIQIDNFLSVAIRIHRLTRF